MKPLVYIASPNAEGDPGINTHFQCWMFNKLMSDGVVWPLAPLWSHFQHIIYPRPYEDWVQYDFAILHRVDACLRMDANHTETNYVQRESSGADAEVEYCNEIGKPVFTVVSELYDWAKRGCSP